MKIIEHKEPAKEPTLQLKQLQVGESFRFATDSFEDALKENLFYRVTVDPNKSLADGRVFIVSLDGKLCLRRDDVHLVIRHETIVQVIR